MRLRASRVGSNLLGEERMCPDVPSSDDINKSRLKLSAYSASLVGNKLLRHLSAFFTG